MKALLPLTEVSFQWISSADTTVCEMLIEEEGRSIPWRGLSVCGPSILPVGTTSLLLCCERLPEMEVWELLRMFASLERGIELVVGGSLCPTAAKAARFWAGNVLESLLWLECMRKWSLEDLQLLIIWNLKSIYKSQEDEVIGKKNKSCHSLD